MRKGLSESKLKLFKFIISIAAITLVVLIYVHQQIELVKLSYAIDYKEKSLEHMLDRKEGLGYNIKELEAPSRLERVLLSQKIDVSFPKRGRVIKIASLSANAGSIGPLRTAKTEKMVNIFGILEFFGIAREAQAREK